MALGPIEYLQKGKIEFISNLTEYDRMYVIKGIRESYNRSKIIEGFLNKLKDKNPYFCFEIIYDMDLYKDDLFYLLEKYNLHTELKSSPDKIKNILNHTKFGKEYVLNNLNEILNSNKRNVYVIVEFIFSNFKEHYDLANKLYLSDSPYIKLVFMKYVTQNYKENMEMIYNQLKSVDNRKENKTIESKNYSIIHPVKNKILNKKIS